MRPPIFLFVLAKRKTAPRPVEERKGRPRDEPVYEDQARHRERRTWYSSCQSPEPARKRVLRTVTKPAPVRGRRREHRNGCTGVVLRRTVAMTSFRPVTTFIALAPFSLWADAPPLPVAEEGGTSAPQPRPWRAVVKQARQGHCGKAVNRFSFRARTKREMGLDLCSLPLPGSGYNGIGYSPLSAQSKKRVILSAEEAGVERSHSSGDRAVRSFDLPRQAWNDTRFACI